MCRGKNRCGCRSGYAGQMGRSSRFVQPSILLSLLEGPSYGYELMERVAELGFQGSGSPDPGSVYRTLRRLEEDGFVVSEWSTGEAGPARRYYKLTQEGRELLDAWIEDIKKRVAALDNFVERYDEIVKMANGKGGE